MKNKLNFKKNLLALSEKIKDDDYAVELYCALCNMKWQNIKNPKIIYSCTWRYAGGLIARIRDKDENYLKFYCNGGEGNVSQRIRKDLKKLGWNKYEAKIQNKLKNKS